MFKAIFENDEDENEDEEEKFNKDEEIEIDEDVQEIEPIKKVEPTKNLITIPSSISGINISEVNKYLRPGKDDAEEEERPQKIIFKKPGSTVETEIKKNNNIDSPSLPEPLKFLQIVKTLAKKSEKSDSDSSTSSGSDSVEFVYEEVSAEKSKKSSKKKKKKKKKHHKKKKKTEKS